MAKGRFGVLVKRSDTGAPVAGASVLAMRVPPAMASTAADGVATFEELEEGPITFAITAPGYRPKGHAGTVNPNSSSFTTVLLDPAIDIYFAIYYKVPDGAFRRAAEHWKAELKTKPINPGTSKIIMHEVTTAAEFKAAWQDVYNQAQAKGSGVKDGRVFSHASKGEGEDGLEFKGGGGEDGTISKGELQSLPSLPWLPGAQLILHGCNTGVAAARGWTPAEVLAKSQKVRTVGQAGYAYFSQSYSTYVEWTNSSTVVYLWAYKRGKNGMIGGGARMEGKEFLP
ncbi:MAG: carboxypeptidase regulatory-like domain-containing protein [Bryobacterales bacterium]|nr:carboxypeptidase regulatory-like domain-containing protein [Bryobacterales bacterium]